MFGYTNPFQAADPYMQQAGNQLTGGYKMAQGAMAPWMASGWGANEDYRRMLSPMQNPSNFYNTTMSGFQLSPAQQYQENQGMEGIANSAAARGTLGSGNEAKALNTYGQNMTNQYAQQYAQNILGINNSALQNYGRLSMMGQNAGNRLSGNAMTYGDENAQLQEARAQMAAAAAASKNQNTFSALGVGAMLPFMPMNNSFLSYALNT